MGVGANSRTIAPHRRKLRSRCGLRRVSRVAGNGWREVLRCVQRLMRQGPSTGSGRTDRGGVRLGCLAAVSSGRTDPGAGQPTSVRGEPIEGP